MFAGIYLCDIKRVVISPNKSLANIIINEFTAV